jgi:hypothetical protein
VCNWFAMQGPVAIILISWNVIFIWEAGYWTRAIQRLALFDLLKVYIPITRSCRNVFRLCRDDDKRLKWEVTHWSIETNRLCWETVHFLFQNIWYKQKRSGSHFRGGHHSETLSYADNCFIFDSDIRFMKRSKRFLIV